MDEAEKVKRFFNRYALSFDTIYTGKGTLRSWINGVLRKSMYDRFDYVLDALDGRDNYSLLDVGCGTGRYAIAAVQRGARQAVGVDSAHSMIDLAVDLAEQANVSEHCDFLAADFLEHEFGQQFDFSIAMGFFDYTKDPVPYLTKMAALTNGRLIASFPIFSVLRSPQRKLRYALIHRCPVYFYTLEGIHHILERSGLTESKIVRLRGGPGSDVLIDVNLT